MNGEKKIGKAQIDFLCTGKDCPGVVKFDLMDLAGKDFETLCPVCHNSYCFDETLRNKLLKLKSLIEAVREAESILGDCSVAVTTPAGEVKIPYSLLLTRLNTMITLQLGDRKVDFHLRTEPVSENTFR